MIRLHILSIPHTITNDEFSHCAFTGKVLRFAPMMRSRGYEVYHYGIETSKPNATKNINLLTKDEWNELRLKSYQFLHPELEIEKIKDRVNNKKEFIGELGNYGTPLYKEFNKRLKEILPLYYRSTATDIVCLPFGYSHEEAISGLNVVAVETGIGYPNSYKNFRIFESYAHLHRVMGDDKKNCQHYWFVVPNYYNIQEWPLNLQPSKKIGFFGRICHIKGCNIVCEIAKCFPDIEFVLCGQGVPDEYLQKAPNITYKEPIEGMDRGRFLNDIVALIAPSLYSEPFCGVNVEAQLCGTPVITNDFGAFVETIEPFKTGMFCHTLADFCEAVQMAIDNKFDRQYIHERAVKKYDMYNVAKQYDYVFKNIIDVYNGNGGWYAKKSHLQILSDA